MPQENRTEELRNNFKTEMRRYLDNGFQPSDCFPFVFQDLIEQSGLGTAERAELSRELLDWTSKIM